MHFKNSCYPLVFVLLISQFAVAQKNTFPIVANNSKVSIFYDNRSATLDSITANMLAEDIERVTSFKPEVMTDIAKAKGNVIVIGSIQSQLIQRFVGAQSSVHKNLLNKWECFAFKTINKPFGNISKALVITGSDARGTSYGVFTLSAKIGVSPWYWWADVPVKKQSELIIDQNDSVSSPPAVKYRGIFINDEDWGLQPWAAKTFEPQTGDIGPKTYAKVFELLLRLKANMIWPAMHPGTKPFFHYPGNVKTAEDFQIIIGSSHAEPMLRNNVGEWNEKTMGPFNYITNKEQVYKYWEDRVKQSSSINAIYSIGMRGVHDSQMEGVKNPKEAVPLLEQIFKDQRGLLARYVNKDVTSIPQVFTAYKEVLDIYDNGLKVPEDVTLVWPDDNYGYIQRLNNEKEQTRKGGAGVYYHASYWGRPHDYLWLPSTHPSLMREEMLKAWETGANRLWVLNVGDIKPQEYNIQEFLDMAYDPTPFKNSRYAKQHLLQWAASIFGDQNAKKIQSILWEYYQLAFERKPEFMGWSQTEPITPTTVTQYNHFFYGDEAQRRINCYEALEKEVNSLRLKVEAASADAFYQLVYYPVVCASWMNKKFLYRDKAVLYARQNRLSASDYASFSKNAYDSIVKETTYYNTVLADGKWKNIMSMKPRDLPVYQPPVIPDISVDSSSGWSIAPEGFVSKDSSLLNEAGSMSLPAFDQLNQQKYFIDIFLTDDKPVEWKATVSHNWLRVSKNNGSLIAEPGKKQMRIWVDIDWSKFSGEDKLSDSIIFTGNDRQITVRVPVQKLNIPGLSAFKGYIENNGFVSIYAADYSHLVNKQSVQWQVVNDLGYTEKALEALPISTKNETISTDPGAIKKNSSMVAYDFYTFTAAAPKVTIFTLPTHPVNNNFSMRYAVSVDDQPLQSIDFKTVGRSEEWKQNVLRNRAETQIQMPFLDKGRHTLKIYCIDPGVMLDEIRIDAGGLIKAYSTVPETRIPHDQ